MVEPVRHRQTKGAATDMFGLPSPRHTSTLPKIDGPAKPAPRSDFGPFGKSKRILGVHAEITHLRLLSCAGVVTQVSVLGGGW
jgi:hypothetical protein